VGNGAPQAFDLVHRRLEQHPRLLVATLQTSQAAESLVQPVAQVRQRQALGQPTCL
jgi:hypothetical protein